EFPDGLLGRTDNLVGHAFALKLLVADRFADHPLGGANGLLRRAFDSLLAHGVGLCSWTWEVACATMPRPRLDSGQRRPRERVDADQGRRAWPQLCLIASSLTEAEG